MYRIILAAIVFLCTLECDAQTTQRLETKDVLCILWLSGIQKEDLDVNMLRKLQQHNVNIDDINDIGKLRSRCLNRNYTEYINGTAEINFSNLLTTKNESPTVNETKANADESNTIKMSELEIAVQHILNSQKFKKMSNESKYNEDQEKESYQEEHVLNKVPTENITDTIITTATPKTEANDDEQEAFENVESNVTVAPLKRPIVNPNEMKLLNDLSNDTNLEVEHISRIIADYITRKRNLSTNGVNRSLNIRNDQVFNQVKREHTLKSVNKVDSNPSIKKVSVNNENYTVVEATNKERKRFSNLNEMNNNPLFIIYNEGYKDKHIMYDENKQRRVNDLFINEYVNNTSEDGDVGQQHGKNAQRDMFKEIAYSVKSIVSHYIDAPRSSPTTITTEAIKLSTTTKKQDKREMDEIFMYENINKMYQEMQASRVFITQTTEKATTFPRQDQILHGAFEMYKNFGNMYKYFKLMANNKQDEVKIITTTKVPVIQTSVRTTVAEQFKNKLHKNSNILMKLTDMYKQMQRLKITNTTSTTSTSTTVTPQPSTTVKKKLQNSSEIFNNLQELFKLLGKSPGTTTVTTTTETTTTMTTKNIRTESEETFDILENLKEIYQKLKIPHESSHLNSEILTTPPNHIEPTEASPVYKNRYMLTPARVDFNEQSGTGPSTNQIMKPDFARYIYESNHPVNISNFQPSDIYFRGGNQQTQMDIPQNIYYNKLNPIQYKSIQNPMPYYIASQSTDSRLTVPRNGPVPFPYQTKLSVNSQSSPNNPLISQTNPAILFNNNQPNLPLIDPYKMPLTSSKNAFIAPIPSLDNHPMLSSDPILSENRQVSFNNQMSSRTQRISPYDRFYSPKNRQKPPQNMFSPGARVRLAEMSPISSYIPQISQKNRFPQSKNTASGLHSAVNIVQTNFNVVPPLGIRVGEPLNLIHQNVVVHNKKHNNDNANSNRSHRQKYYSRETEEFNEFKELTNGHKNRYHKKKDDKYKFKPKVSGKMARFHEILENSELQADNKEIIPDADNLDAEPIPPRHQVSINNIKQYDNFDKNIRTMMTTQNKVHQLLDKMLQKDSRERPEFDMM